MSEKPTLVILPCIYSKLRIKEANKEAGLMYFSYERKTSLDSILHFIRSHLLPLISFKSQPYLSVQLGNIMLK